MTPTGTMIRTDDERPLWARSTLRRGLPGDNQPTTRAEAKARCPHGVLVHIPLSVDRYWLANEKRAFAVEYATRVDQQGTHECFGGWLL